MKVWKKSTRFDGKAERSESLLNKRQSLKCRYWERNNNEEKNHEITKCIQPGLDQCTGWI